MKNNKEFEDFKNKLNQSDIFLNKDEIRSIYKRLCEHKNNPTQNLSGEVSGNAIRGLRSKIIKNYLLKTYIVVFKDDDTIRLDIDQTDKVNRPNNMDDDEIIQEYITENYGYGKEYEVIDIDSVEIIKL